MNLRHRGLLLPLTGLSTLVLGIALRGLADGAPTDQPLFYAGTLEIDGQPATGALQVTVSIYASNTGGDAACAVTRTTEALAGRFRVDVSDCADTLRAQPNRWVGLRFVDSAGKTHEIPGRAKVGAVPYALEADHALTASGASGPLLDTLNQLQERLGSLERASGLASAFLAYSDTAQDIPNGGGRIVFEDEQYDLADEYDPATGVFSPGAAGRYAFSCQVTWDISALDQESNFEAGLFVNGVERVYDGHYGEGRYATRAVHGFLSLAAGDAVHCGALQLDLGVQALNPYARNVYFEGRRLPY